MEVDVDGGDKIPDIPNEIVLFANNSEVKTLSTPISWTARVTSRISEDFN